MGILGFFGDAIALPFEIIGDVTGITPAIRAYTESDDDSPFGTLDRLESMAENFEDIFDGD